MSNEPELIDIDEALAFAVATRKNVRDSKKPLVLEFINDLLDARNLCTKCTGDKE